MSVLKNEAVYPSATTVLICHTIQKCRISGDDVMSLYNRKGWQKRKKKHFPRPGQYEIVCRESAKNTKVEPLLCQQTLDLRQNPAYVIGQFPSRCVHVNIVLVTPFLHNNILTVANVYYNTSTKLFLEGVRRIIMYI